MQFLIQIIWAIISNYILSDLVIFNYMIKFLKSDVTQSSHVDGYFKYKADLNDSI